MRVIRIQLVTIICMASQACGTMPVPGNSESAQVVSQQDVVLSRVRVRAESKNSPKPQQKLVAKPPKTLPQSKPIVATKPVTHKPIKQQASAKTPSVKTINPTNTVIAKPSKTPVAPHNTGNLLVTAPKPVAQKAKTPVTTTIKPKPVEKSEKITVAFVSKPIDPVEPKTSSEDDFKYNLAQQYYDKHKYQNTIDVLETSSHDTLAKNNKLRGLLVLAYSRHARALVSSSALSAAQLVLEKAINLEPYNRRIHEQISDIKNVRESNRVYKIALVSYNSGKKQQAFKSFQKVLILNPKHDKAKKYYERMKSVVVDNYHKKALQFYYAQKLSKAIREWNNLLEVDPENDLAKIYKSRAIELQRKFKNLNSPTL